MSFLGLQITLTGTKSQVTDWKLKLVKYGAQPACSRTPNAVSVLVLMSQVIVDSFNTNSWYVLMSLKHHPLNLPPFTRRSRKQ